MKTIPIDKIDLDEINVRKSAFAVDELTDSVKEDGIVEPIILRPKEDRFKVVAGKRRFIACKEAGYKELKVGGDKPEAIIRDLTDDEALRISFIEGIHQQELDPMDKANALNKLMEFEGVDITKKHQKRGYENAIRNIVKKTGIAFSHIDMYLNLLNISPKMQKAVSEKKIPIDVTTRIRSFSKDIQEQLVDILAGVTQVEARDIIKYIKEHPKTSPERAKEIVFSNKKFYYKVGLLGEVYFPLYKYSTKNRKSIGDIINKILKEWVSKNA